MIKGRFSQRLMQFLMIRPQIEFDLTVSSCWATNRHKTLLKLSHLGRVASRRREIESISWNLKEIPQTLARNRVSTYVHYVGSDVCGPFGLIAHTRLSSPPPRAIAVVASVFCALLHAPRQGCSTDTRAAQPHAYAGKGTHGGAATRRSVTSQLLPAPCREIRGRNV